VKTYFQILLTLFIFLMGCEREGWRNPRERFESFQKHLIKSENVKAMEFIDPDDRKIFEEDFKAIPKDYDLSPDKVLFVGSMKSPRMIRRIELSMIPKEEPKMGTPLTLTLHYLNEDTQNAYLVWRGKWYVDLFR